MARRCRSGIGAIPDAVLRAPRRQARSRRAHRDVLGRRASISSKAASITNRRKTVHAGRIVTSFVNGTPARSTTSSTTTRRRVPPAAIARTTPRIIRKNDKVIAINSALEIDLTGQVVRRLDRPPHLLGHRRADGLHPRRGAVARRQADHRAAVDGLRAAPCRASLSALKPGAGVVTTRGHVHWVVTEIRRA